MVYDDRHRTFLQVIMQEGAVHDDDATALCFKIFDDKANISMVVSSINDKLAPLEMILKSGLCEVTGEKYWSVVGTTHEESIKIPSEFTPAQRALLRIIYSEIITSEDGCISSTDCLNLSSNIECKLTMTDADGFIKFLVAKKWLHSEDGEIYMGVRSIAELMPYFRATYQDSFHNCSLCREVVFHGDKCENCDKIFHMYCLRKFKAVQNDSKCPKCKNEMKHD